MYYFCCLFLINKTVITIIFMAFILELIDKLGKNRLI